MSKWKEESIPWSLTVDHIWPKGMVHQWVSGVTAGSRVTLGSLTQGTILTCRDWPAGRTGTQGAVAWMVHSLAHSQAGDGDLSKGASCRNSCLFRESLRKHLSRTTFLCGYFSSVVCFSDWFVHCTNLNTSCVQKAVLNPERSWGARPAGAYASSSGPESLPKWQERWYQSRSHAWEHSAGPSAAVLWVLCYSS